MDYEEKYWDPFEGLVREISGRQIDPPEESSTRLQLRNIASEAQVTYSDPQRLVESLHKILCQTINPSTGLRSVKVFSGNWPSGELRSADERTCRVLLPRLEIYDCRTQRSGESPLLDFLQEEYHVYVERLAKEGEKDSRPED